MSKGSEERAIEQTLSARDQTASDLDQTASDDDLQAGGDPITHRSSRLARGRTRRSRERTSALRAGQRHLRVLVADEGPERLESLGAVVAELGHEVVAGVDERPDVALIGLGVSSDHALELIDEIVHEAACPVIALLPAQDPGYVREAAKRGIFAYIVEAGPEELQSAIDITLRRFTEYHDLQGAFGRRAVIEQAKGMLMARHGINGDEAFDLLRNHSQHGGGRLSEIAAAVVDTNSLLPPGAGSDQG